MANQTTSARTIRKIHPPRVIVIASLHARHRGWSLPRMIAGGGNQRQRNWQGGGRAPRATAMALPPRSEWGIGGHCRWEGDACQGARPTKNPPRAWPLRGGFHPYLVGGKGFGPSTSALRTPRSP